jgi:hypothetical protein
MQCSVRVAYHGGKPARQGSDPIRRAMHLWCVQCSRLNARNTRVHSISKSGRAQGERERELPGPGNGATLR